MDALIGWQGLRITVPEDWSVGAIGGDRNSGYLRVDDPDMPRLEIKWSQGSGNEATQRVLERYLKDIERRGRRKSEPPQTELGIKLVSKRQKRKEDIHGFRWQSDVCAYGIIWRCPDCKRVVICQTMSRTPDLRDAAEELFESLEDHSDDGWDLWSLYGLIFQAPQDYLLQKPKLMTGQIDLRFARGRRRKETLRVMRSGMAELTLRNSSLSIWTEADLRQTYRDFRPRVADVDFRGHNALTYKVFSSLIRDRALDAARKMLQRDRLQLNGVCWHCAEQDKIFLVDGVVPESRAEIIHNVAETVHCH